MTKQILAAGLVLAAAGCAAPMQDLYLYQGLKPAEGAHANDGVFQDFYSDSDTLARIWADPDATMHKGKENAWVQAHVDRTDTVPHLAVQFERAGYGTSVEIAPKHKVPERIPENAVISFEMMSEQPVCVGVRMQEHDGEVWGYGKPQLEYDRQCTSDAGVWKTHTLAVNKDKWFKFVYGGNTNLGNDTFDEQMVTMMTFEFGLAAKYHLAQGRSQVNLRNITITSAASADEAVEEAELAQR